MSTLNAEPARTPGMTRIAWMPPGDRVIPKIAAIVCAGILVRLLVWFAFDHERDLYGGDSQYYLAVGKSILELGIHGDAGVPDAWRPPLYSLFAGLVAWVSDSALMFYIVQGAIYIGFALAVFALLRRHAGGTAFLAALLIAASPFGAIFNGRVLSENLVGPLLVLGALVFAYSRHSAWYAVSGVLLGLAALTRDIYALLPLVLILAGWWSGARKSRLTVFLLAFLVVVLPWMYRNASLPEGSPRLGGNMWQTLWAGTWVRNADFTFDDKLPPEAVRTLVGKWSEEAMVQAWRSHDQPFFKEVVLHYATHHTGELVRAWIARYPRLWMGTRSDLSTTRLDRDSLAWLVMKGTLFALNGTVILLAIFGAVVALRTGALPAMLLAPVLYNALIHVPFYNIEPRYTQPVLPILEIFCALLLGAAYSRLAGRHRGELST